MLHSVGVNDATPDLISGADAARILDVNRTTVYRWGRAGKLPIAVHLRRGMLFDRAEVEALAAVEHDHAKAS